MVINGNTVTNTITFTGAVSGTTFSATTEFKGKNACTAWVNFDGTTTPPTIRDSYNVSKVIRTSTGNYDIYFENNIDVNKISANVSYRQSETPGWSGMSGGIGVYNNKLILTTRNYLNTVINPADCYIQIFGGKE